MYESDNYTDLPFKAVESLCFEESYEDGEELYEFLYITPTIDEGKYQYFSVFFEKDEEVGVIHYSQSGSYFSEQLMTVQSSDYPLDREVFEMEILNQKSEEFFERLEEMYEGDSKAFPKEIRWLMRQIVGEELYGKDFYAEV